MSTNSNIAWTDHTLNPWWGCQKVAQGCANCYAEAVAGRYLAGRRVWGPGSDRKIASEKVWGDPVRWNARAKREGRTFRVFCLSMGDCLEDHPSLVEPRKRLVGLVESTPFLDWQLLTKRPENAAMFGWGASWPSNAWFGASAATRNEIIGNAGTLAKVEGPRIRFLSIEPLIDAPGNMEGLLLSTTPGSANGRKHLIHWVIVGGESGANRRECDPAWIDSVVAQCVALGVPVFVKQDAGPKPGKQGRLSDATWAHKEFPA